MSELRIPSLQAIVLLSGVFFCAVSANAQSISIRSEPGRIVLQSEDHPIATYVYQDPQISRPYFAHVHVPGDIQVTRNHPPKAEIDLVDHATFHPGIWLAFGDLSGEDYWRNKARVRHNRIVEIATTDQAEGFFTVENSYSHSDRPEQSVCLEVCRYTISIEPDGYLLICDSLFNSRTAFVFGDQEEMGLGVRLATPITVKSGGRIVDAAGRVNEKGIWGKSTEWCDYSGMIDGHKVGIMVMADPANLRPMRMHVRDYGLMTANPFGQKVFGEAQPSRIEIAANDSFRLRFAVLLHASRKGEIDHSGIYSKVIRRLTNAQRPNL